MRARLRLRVAGRDLSELRLRQRTSTDEPMTSTDLSRSLKTHRQSKGLTLEALARISGVSRAMISKIERGEAVPTTSVLGKLAEALELSLSQLIGGAARRGPVRVPAAEQPVFREPGTGFERRSLSPLYRGRGVDLALNRLAPGGRTGPFPSHRHGVEEHLYVQSGTVRISVGEEAWDLGPGDYLFYPADLDHVFANIGEDEAVFLVVIDSTQAR